MSLRSVCLATLCALCLPAVAQEAEEAEWQQITVGGETRYVMPNEVARGLGIPRQDVPDEENAAWVYIQAFNVLPEEPAQGNISPLRRRGEPRTEPTSRDKFDQQYGQAMEAPWDAAQSEELYAWYQTTAEARQLFKKATSMGRCQLPILTGQPGVTFLAALIMPNLSGMRSLARLMVLEGHLLEQEGKDREAVEAYLAAFRAGGHLGREPILITGLVGVACQAIATEAMAKCLARHEIPRGTLEWLARQLAGLEGCLPNRRAWIAGERAMAVQIAGMRPDEIIAVAGEPCEFSEPQRAFMRSRAFRILWPDRTLRRDFDRFYDRVEELAHMPPWDTVAVTRDTDEIEFSRQYVKDWNILAWMLLPALYRPQVAYVRGISSYHALRINVALRLYRAERGGYPDALASLVPQYLDELPVDPFSGKAFHYRREGDGWLLYSVGPDQDDDGGREAERDWREDGDLVYRSRLREEEQ